MSLLRNIWNYLIELKSLQNIKAKVYFRWMDFKDRFVSLLASGFVIDFGNFILTSIIVTLILVFAESKWVKDNFGNTHTYLATSFSFLIGIAAALYYAKQRKERSKQDGYRKINEIMNSSFQILFEFFIEKMTLIREATTKTRVTQYLHEFSESNLFENLSASLELFLKVLFSDELERKIDIYKFDSGNQRLCSISDTMINGGYVSGQRSSEFTIQRSASIYTSLAEYSFSRNRIGYLRHIERISLLLNALTDEEYKQRLVERRRLYYEPHSVNEGFPPGTIICFPLSYGGDKYGILSIAFKNQNIEPELRRFGISIEDFQKSISTFIEKYTKFATHTSQGIANLIQKFGR